MKSEKKEKARVWAEEAEPVEGRKVEGQLETGPGGRALFPYLLVDASFTGTVH